MNTSNRKRRKRRVVITPDDEQLFKSFLDKNGYRLVDYDYNFASGIEEFVLLKNAMRVYLLQDKSLPMQMVNLVFEIGSVDELDDTRGLTHFLEHLGFDGSVRFRPDKKTSIDWILTKLAGGMNNATTWFDRTNYHEEFLTGKERLRVVLSFEYDRWRQGGLLLSDAAIKLQIQVVRNEKERGENNPDQKLLSTIAEVAIPYHSYRVDTIGTNSGIEGVTRAKLVDFLKKYYWSDNLVVMVLGNFEREEALSLIKKEMGKLNRSPKPIPKVDIVDPPQEGEKRVVIKKGNDLAYVNVAWHNEAGCKKSSHVMNVIAAIVGDTSRANTRSYQMLIGGKKPLATFGYASNMQLRHPYLFYVTAQALPETKPEDLEHALCAMMARFSTELVSDEELQRAKNYLIKSMTLRTSDIVELAQQLTESIAISGSWKWLRDYPANINAVTKEEIQQVAQRFFTWKQRTVGYYLPDDQTSSTNEKPPEPEQKEEPKATPARRTPSKRGKPVAPKACKRSSKGACAAKRSPIIGPMEIPRVDLNKQVVQKQFLNGMPVMIMPLKRSKTVSVSMQFLAGDFFAPQGKSLVPSMVARMLTMGSARFSKEVIGDTLDDMGTSLSVASDAFICSLKSDAVIGDFTRLLDLLQDIIRNPLFDESELATRKELTRAGLADSKNNTSAAAHNALSRALYVPGSPYWTKTFDELIEEVDAITVDDLKAFHKEHFSPANMTLSIVGDVDPAATVTLLEERFSNWVGGARKSITAPQSPLPTTARTITIAIPGKANVDNLLGHPCKVSITAEDYFAYLLACNALGVDMFTTPLGALRVKYGLTYGIRCKFQNVTTSGGTWFITFTVNPKNVKQSHEIVNGIVTDFVANGVDEETYKMEIGRAQGYFLLNLRTYAGLATSLAYHELLMPGNGVKFMDEYTDNVAKVKRDQMNSAVRDLIHPDKLVTVIAGSVPTEQLA
jgi:zinc protease